MVCYDGNDVTDVSLVVGMLVKSSVYMGNGRETMCFWDSFASMVVCSFRDVDLGCNHIFPGLSQHFHRIAQFSGCGDAMSYRDSHW